MARALARPSRLAMAALALLALGACTGTQEPLLPTILIVGSNGAAGPQLQLIQDVYEPGADPPRSLRPIPGSMRALPAEPVSLDMVDRNGSREELVVLLENGELRFFDTSALDPADSAGFLESRAPVDVPAMLPSEVTGEAPVCLSSVRVGSEGRFAALLDDATCRSGQDPMIHVVDLEAGEHVFTVDDLSLLPYGIHVEQASDRLYYAVDDIAAIEIRSVPLAGGSSSTVGRTELSPDGATRTDLARLEVGIGILVNDSLAVVPLGQEAQDPVSTISGARMLLADPSGSMAELVVFASTRAAIHADASDDDPETLQVRSTPVDATFEPGQRFAYLLEVGGIEILDLYPYAEPQADRLLFREVPGMDGPTVITWGFAVQSGLEGGP